MRSFTDDEVLRFLAEKRDHLRTSPKEGHGMACPHGTIGRISDEVMMWRQEAIRRGLSVAKRKGGDNG